jgi:MFS family permease
MPRLPLPRILTDLALDRHALAALVGGSAALFAAGLEPKVWGATLTTVQAAIRARPELEAVVLLAAVASAVTLLVAGAIGDLRRARPLVIGGLAVIAVTSATGLVVQSGPLFMATRLLGAGASALVIPAALASVATAYRGVPRATAIGIAYAAYGGAQALMPILLTAIPGARWPGFVAATIAALVALRIAWRRIPDLERPGRVERPYVLGTALWASGVVAVSTGVLWLGGGWDNPVRLAIIGLGIGLLLAFLAWEARRRAEHPASLRVDRRPVTIALFVGVVIAIAQAVPMVQLPLYFNIVAGYGPLFGLVAVVPMFAALVVAGPVAGFLLARSSPRVLVGAGLVTVGLGNLAVALIAGRGSGYALFVVPLVLIGAGFVIATTVRTAIIFASVPRGLPATAAALNEASLAVGNRVGIVLVTAIVAQTAMSALEPSLAAMSPGAAAAARQQFSDLLVAVGTPSFASLTEAVHQADVASYVDAYVTGIRSAMFWAAWRRWSVGWWHGSGSVAATPRDAGRRPMAAVYEHRDERAAADA